MKHTVRISSQSTIRTIPDTGIYTEALRESTTREKKMFPGFSAALDVIFFSTHRFAFKIYQLLKQFVP